VRVWTDQIPLDTGNPAIRGGRAMRGTLLVFQPHAVPQVMDFLHPPTLEEVQAVVGSDLQVVPGFRTIRYGAVVMDCFALCNANGKHKGLAMNDLATIAWKEAFRSNANRSLGRISRRPVR